ncbi:neuropeptide receptor 22 [Maniola jurtina]|uniref:neuropeptide receptor 22 n=1 Tax=Maniola jurtina TaxID=191418 RepID=UPI001E68EFCD|nr:neuropeptide receptor 22 [Maniola jurtina]
MDYAKMYGNVEFDYQIPSFLINWSTDYDTSEPEVDLSQYPFPNKLWHIKPAKEVALKTTAMLIVGVTGIFLNSVIIIILLKNKWLWTASNYLIGNLAFIDLITLIFCPWFMLVRDFHQNFVLNNFGCRFEGFLQASLLLAGVAAVMLVSYDRLAAATLTAEARITKKAAPKLIVASWIIPMGLSLPWIIERKFIERQWLDFLETFCYEDPKMLPIYWHCIVILLVWIPLGVMLLTYGTIIWRLERSARELSSRGGGQTITQARGKAMRITACILLVAAVCRVPYTALVYMRNNLPNEINAVEGGYQIMWFIASYLMYLNCAINPLIYGFTNTRFRRAMDRTPGVAWFKFGTWCCACATVVKKKQSLQNNNVEKIFVVVASPRPNRKISRVVRNILHINKQTLELSVPKVDEATTKPTKVTPLKVEQLDFKADEENDKVFIAQGLEVTISERIVINEERSNL